MRFHLIISIIFAAAAAILAISESLKVRLILLVFILVLYQASTISFGIEMDNEYRLKWKRKERKVSEDIYLRFFKAKSE